MSSTLTDARDRGSMTDYRVVVVGTDGSALAEPTVARAAWLAHHDDADLVIVCAWTAQTRRQDAIASFSTGDTSRIGQVVGRAAASSAIAAAVQTAEGQGATISAALLVEGEPAAALLEIAAERSADLIVLGATSRVSLAERLLGTVASDVLRRADVDVLVVRPVPDGGDLPVPESES